MAERICDSCGKKKQLEGGKTCEKGHFVCYSCRNVGVFSSGRATCPICKTKLKQRRKEMGFEGPPGKPEQGVVKCLHCGGSGKDSKGEKCKPCNGTGQVRTS